MVSSHKKEMYADLENELKELETFYKNHGPTRKSLTDKKESFLKEQFALLGQILKFILLKPWLNESEFIYFTDWNPEYLLLGHFFEGLLRTILMKELPVDLFFKKGYNLDTNSYTLLRALSAEFLELDPIKKLNEKQQTRISNLLKYIRIQRNIYVHNLPRSFDTYRIRYHLYHLIAVIYKLFNIPLDEDLNGLLLKEISAQKVSSGIDFEPVLEGFLKG